jgi:hypothetical protein
VLTIQESQRCMQTCNQPEEVELGYDPDPQVRLLVTFSWRLGLLAARIQDRFESREARLGSLTLPPKIRLEVRRARE